MKLDQLTKGLTQAFVQEKHRIVFWYDAEQSFTDSLAEINKVIGDIKILNMQGESALGTKILLEREDTENKYLLYFPYAEPDPEQDWLLDIKLYSRTFYADRFSILLNEFGLEQPTLREHLTKRATYLASKERINNLKRYLKPNFDENQIDMAMIASVLKADSIDINDIILALTNKLASQPAGLMHNPTEIAELKKYGLLSTLITQVALWLDIPSSVTTIADEEMEFNLGKLFVQLLVTELFNNLNQQPWASSLIFPSNVAKATSRSIITRWRDSKQYSQSYITIAKWVSDSLGIDEKLHQLPLAKLLALDTFEVIEVLIIRDLVEQIPMATLTQLQELQIAVDNRLSKFWVTAWLPDKTKNPYLYTYQALSSAIGLFSLRQKYDNGFNFDTLIAFYQAYEQEIYQFDLHYRHYCEGQKATGLLLENLTNEVEKCYSYWYIDNLAQSWDRKIEQENRLENWQLDGIINQQKFYQHWIQPLTGSTQARRTAVIISDALRYEAGVELCERINQKRYSKASITSQLGVLPSYTALGKASLLPHEIIEYKSDASSEKSEVYVDGISSEGTNNRSRILAKYTQNKGLAITAEEVMAFNKQQGRETFKPYEIIYIYHDTIDTIGDKLPTENSTFEAVETAIEQLAELSQKIVRDYNTSTVFVTADHGFLFQQREMQETDRKRLDTVQKQYLIKNKKRYVIAHQLPENDGVWHGTTSKTANTQSDTQFWLPKGNQRFHFVGGARFSHGGAMPQEIVVPVIAVNGLRGERAQDRTQRNVQFSLLSHVVKIVSYEHPIDFIQIEPVSELIKPSIVTVAIYDGNTKISSEETVVFDSISEDFNERLKSVQIALAGTTFDRKKDYYLVIKDKSSEIELLRNKVIIDIGYID